MRVLASYEVCGLHTSHSDCGRHDELPQVVRLSVFEDRQCSLQCFCLDPCLHVEAAELLIVLVEDPTYRFEVPQLCHGAVIAGWQSCEVEAMRRPQQMIRKAVDLHLPSRNLHRE